MMRSTTTRTWPETAGRLVRANLGAALALLLFGGLARSSAAHGPRQQATRPAPIVRALPSARPAAPANGFVPRSGQNQEHLQQWMRSHSNLTLDQQQRALDNESGFRQLNPEVQQRMHQRLAQLNAMTPEQRQRAYARTEAMERLAPEQRQQVRTALASLGNLPKDRRVLVARQFRAMREMPVTERQSYLNSPAVRSQYSDQERQTLTGLLEVEPYLPPPAQPAAAPTTPAPPQ